MEYRPLPRRLGSNLTRSILLRGLKQGRCLHKGAPDKLGWSSRLSGR